MNVFQGFSRKSSASDAELDARLSRLRSEFVQAKGAVGENFREGLAVIERRLDEAEGLACRATDGTGSPSADAAALKEERMRIAHELEAELCKFKPFELLYPTWTRLRQNLYRFDDKARREAWERDMSERISASLVSADPNQELALRQRLRQLTLELDESAARFNRLNDERAAATRGVMKLGAGLTALFGGIIVACMALAAGPASPPLVFLLSGIAAGAMGAVFSRVAAPRDERTRPQFVGLVRWDMLVRVCIGGGAALLVTATLLSGKVFELPEEGVARAAYVVVFSFGAGFSDRFFKSMLAQAIGTRRSRSSGDRS